MHEDRSNSDNVQTAPQWFKAVYHVGRPVAFVLRFLARHHMFIGTLALAGYMVSMQPDLRPGMGCIVKLHDGTLFHYRPNGSVDKGHVDGLGLMESLFLKLIPSCAAASTR